MDNMEFIPVSRGIIVINNDGSVDISDLAMIKAQEIMNIMQNLLLNMLNI